MKEKEFRKYPKYKPSGIEWIGEIPEHWVVKKVKHIAKTIAGGTPSTTNQEYWNGDIPWLNSGKVQNNIIDLESVDKYITKLGLEESSTKMIKSNSVLVALTGATCGNIGFLTFSSTANQSIVAIENNNEVNPKFLFYFLLSQREQILIEKSGGAQSGINEGDVKNIILSLPPLSEQTAIANFLDEKTAKIDSLIEKKKKLIELYKEEKTALINQAVTLGINPNVKLKPSGIDWLGDIPEHWEVKKLKYVCKFEYGESLSVDQREEGNIPVFGSNGITGYHKNAITLSPCIIVGRKGSFGKVNWSDKECFPIDTTYFIDKNKTAENLRFIYFLLITLNLDSISKDTGVPGLNREDAYSNLVSIPPLEEQQQIVEYIESETKRIDDKITRAEKEIELLQEYRTALISEVVTGKIKV